MDYIKVKAGVATRDPLPEFLQGLERESLVGLTWTDPALGVSDSAWWPEEDRSPALGAHEHYGDETLTIDRERAVVICIRQVNPWTEEEILAEIRSKVPQQVAMWQARAIMIEDEILDDVNAYLAAITDEKARKLAQDKFEYSNTVRRDDPLVKFVIPQLGKSEAEIDAMFIRASGL